jgi:hypothetical protein
MKRGDIFTHKRWLDAQHKPLRCVVTRVALGVVYWQAEGERKAHHYFRIEQADRYVMPDHAVQD